MIEWELTRYANLSFSTEKVLFISWTIGAVSLEWKHFGAMFKTAAPKSPFLWVQKVQTRNTISEVVSVRICLDWLRRSQSCRPPHRSHTPYASSSNRASWYRTFFVLLDVGLLASNDPQWTCVFVAVRALAYECSRCFSTFSPRGRSRQSEVGSD